MWQPIETAPRGCKLLLAYRNKAGHWRRIIGRYYPPNSLPAPEDSDDEFAPEGWYEESESHEVLLFTEEPPTHWQLIPAPPGDAK